MNRKIIFPWLLALLLGGATLQVSAQGTAFFYQGRLNNNGSAASGSYDFNFAIYDAATNGNVIGSSLTNFAIAVSSGLFTATLDFGPVFTGTNYWLAIGVRPNGSTNAFTTLLPRQPLLPVPYAVFATGASNLLGTVSAAQLSGTLGSAQVTGTYSGTVNFSNAADSFFGKFSGNGVALTNLNASMLSTGTVADVRLSTNVALLSQSQVYGGSNVFTGSNIFTGVNFFTSAGNSFAGNGTNLTSLNASQLAGGTVADTRLSTNVALLNQSQAYGGTNLFTGANNFTNRGNSFVGSFFGNGLVGWIPFAGTSTQAMSDAGYMLTSSQFTTVTMPASPSPGDIVRISGAGTGGWRVLGSGSQNFIGNFSSYRNSVWISPAGGSWLAMAASADGSRMYVAGSSGLSYSTDAGHSWSATSLSGGWNGVATSADGTVVYAAATGVAMQISTNGGASWTVINSISASNCLAVGCSSDGTKVVASVKNGSVYYSANSGASWTATGLASGNWLAVAYSGDGTKFAAANSSGTVYSSVSGSVGVAANLTSLACSTDGSKLVVSASPGLIYTSTSSGASWAASTAPSAYWSCLAASADCTRIIAGINGNVIYGTANFGANWSALAGSTNAAWSGLAASDDGTKLAGCVNTGSGGIFYSTASAQSVNSTNTFITGSQGTAVELQYIGNNQFMPVSSAGSLWVN